MTATGPETNRYLSLSVVILLASLSAGALATGAVVTLGAASSNAALRSGATFLVMAALAALAAYLEHKRSRHERAAAAAREQMRDILKTVHDGLFLLDPQHRIGAVWSDALSGMFGREDFAGMSLEDLLRDSVSPETLATAIKYLKLLWSARAQDTLIRDINPLNQVEVRPRGAKDSRFLQFTFLRVVRAEAVRHVVCSVTDVTAAVLLTREGQDSQADANAQLDMVLGLMQIDPLQLGAFLSTADTGLEIVNATLRKPARSADDFRGKLDELSRQFHSLEADATAVNLKSIATRLQDLQELITGCRSNTNLSGSEFLPIVVRLDELLAHLTTVREIAVRIAAVKEASPAAAAVAIETPVFARKERKNGDEQAEPAKAAATSTEDMAVDRVSPALTAMAKRMAKENDKRIALSISGLERVPRPYFSTVNTCVVQMLRNALLHGIEGPDARRVNHKDEQGVIKIDFTRSNDSYQLIVEDDGAGLDARLLKNAALRMQMITLEEADAMNTRAAVALIFRPGFSTRQRQSADSDRDVGMDVVARTVQELGGKIGVSSHPGKYTRFTVLLPPIKESASAVA
jgi:signal transduction histidine kinase